MSELLQKLDRVYIGIQNLNVQQTKENTAIILDALTVLEEAYNFVKEREKENERNDSTGERDAD